MNWNDLHFALVNQINIELQKQGKTERLELTLVGRHAGVQRITPAEKANLVDKKYIMFPDTKTRAHYFLTGFLISLTF